MARNDNGCSIIITGIILAIFSIAEAFDGKFIPLIGILIIVLFFWIWSLVEKNKEQRYNQKTLQNSGQYYKKNNSKIPSFIIILVVVVIALFFLTDKKEAIDYGVEPSMTQNVFVDTSIVVDTISTDTSITDLSISSVEKEDLNLSDSLSLNILYNELIVFMHSKNNYFAKITSDFDALDINGLLIINNSSVRLLKSKMKYLSGSEFSKFGSEFENLAEGHFVVISCNTENCIYNSEERHYELAIIQPFETKNDCIEFIYLCDRIREMIKQ